MPQYTTRTHKNMILMLVKQKIQTIYRTQYLSLKKPNKLGIDKTIRKDYTELTFCCVFAVDILKSIRFT